MNKYLKIFNVMCLGALLSITSCIPEGKDLIEGKGPTLVKITEGGSLNTISFQKGTGTLTLSFQVLRNAVSNADLNTEVNVKLSVDNTLMASYNTANSANLVTLASNLYAISGTDLKFAAGEFAKTVTITIDKTKIPSGVDNAIVLSTSVVSGNATITKTGQGSIMYKIIVSNQYEGSYHSTGKFVHPTSPRDIDRDKTLKTINDTTSETEYADLGTPMWLVVNADNTVTVIPKGTSAATGFTMFDVNKYDPATKTFTLNYKYVGSNGDRVISEVIVKK